MEIDKNDGNDGHIYGLEKWMTYRTYEPQTQINEAILVHNITEELILLV